MEAQGRPRASEFVSARLRYGSGDWDCNPKVAANALNSVVEYTTIRVFPEGAIFGEHGRLPKLPARHPVYRSFFTFEKGPPQTSHELNGWGMTSCTTTSVGWTRRDRLSVLYSNKDYGCEWDYDWRNKRFQREDNTKFAVNIVVYAMTA